MCFIVPKKGVFEHQNEGVLDFYNLGGEEEPYRMSSPRQREFRTL